MKQAVSSLGVSILVSVLSLWAPPRAEGAMESEVYGQPPRGALVADPVAHARAKAAANRKAALFADRSSGTVEATSTSAPTAGPSFEGQLHPLVTPPDPTGAIGPTRYVQLINLRYGIYNRSGTLLASGGLDTLTDHPLLNLTDPQIIWDATTERFYYVATDRVQNTLAWGFSKTDSPSSSRPEDDWCQYTADFGYVDAFPDYPQLGDTADFLLIGVNVFVNNGDCAPCGGYLGSDVDWITKPPPGPITSCPPESSFQLGGFADLKHEGGTDAITPVPAEHVDASSTGYVVSAASVDNQAEDFISVFEITRDPDTGVAQISHAKTLSVPFFSMPANAPQKGTVRKLATLDGRLEHAVAAVDPRLGHIAVWTAHAVFGGAGSEERWYEIDPVGPTPSLFQSGVATSPTLYVWNGAVSPDRVVNAAGSAFGSNMVMGFNTSSSTTYPAIQMVSKVGSDPPSGFVLVKQSPGFNADYFCQKACRWGDYSGAEPDPAADLTGNSGIVWLTNEWNVASAKNKGNDSTSIDSRTWIWAATP